MAAFSWPAAVPENEFTIGGFAKSAVFLFFLASL